MLDKNTYSASNRDFQKIQEYEKKYASRIEIFLDIAETELLENYKKKEFLMIRRTNLGQWFTHGKILLYEI